jgi:LPS export ABC transporter permease LptG
MIRKINKYLVQCFLKNFFIVIASFTALFFLINLIDIFNRVSKEEINFNILLYLAFLKTPQSLTTVVASVILISAIYTFYQHSNRSEIVIIRNCGFSLWKLSQPVFISAIILAIIWITIFNYLEILALKKYNSLESKYIKTEMRENIVIKDGIWFKQVNQENVGNIIIVVRKIYKNSTELYDISMWFFNHKQVFYKKIDAKKMILENKFWSIEEGILNDQDNINQLIKNINIPTEIDKDFLKKKIMNLENSVNYYNIFELPKIINDLEKSGLDTKKFKTYFHNKLNFIISFSAMVLFALFFGENMARNQKSTIKLFIGIVFGLLVFLTSSIFSTLGSSGLISIFEATWLIGIIYLAIAIILIYQKENSGS